MRFTKPWKRSLAAAAAALTLAFAGAAGVSGCSAQPTAQLEEGASAQSGQTYSVADFAKLIEKPDVVLVDVRTQSEYDAGHIPGAELLDVTGPEFASAITSLDPSKTYALYCRSGKRSQTALQQMTDAGLKAFDLAGGFNAWDGDVE